MLLSSAALVASVIIINKYCKSIQSVPKWLWRLTQGGSTVHHLAENSQTTLESVDQKSNLNVSEISAQTVSENNTAVIEIHQRKWKLVLLKVDRFLFYLFVTASVALFIVAFTGIAIFSQNQCSSLME